MPAYRKRKEGDTWHWHPDCSNWPKTEYEQIYGNPKYGQFCEECKAKDEQLRKDKALRSEKKSQDH